MINDSHLMTNVKKEIERRGKLRYVRRDKTYYDRKEDSKSPPCKMVELE